MTFGKLHVAHGQRSLLACGALGIIGLGVAVAGVWGLDAIESRFLAESMALMTRARSMDRIEEAMVAGDLTRVTTLVESGAPDGLLDAARLGDREGIERALHAARERDRRALETELSAHDDRRRLSGWAFGIGTITSLTSIVILLAVIAWRQKQEPASSLLALEPARANQALVALEETFRHRVERLYTTQLKKEESDRFAAFGEVAAGLSHGLKTPLAGIRAVAQLARMKLPPDDPTRAHIDRIIEEVDGLVEQIRRFLHAAGPSSNRSQRVPLARFVENLEHDYASAARGRNLIWISEIDASVGDAIEVDVDPALVEMALRNIVENAISAAPDGSTIKARCGRCSAPERAGLDDETPRTKPLGWAEVCVIDEGPGAPDAIVQGMPVDSKKPGGSGLGVAIARRVASRHHGALVVDVPETSRGTRVHFVLPIAEDAQRREEPT